jgi:hypothetical protein
MGKDARPYAKGHDANDRYDMQSLVMGEWVTICRVTKAGGANKARTGAKNSGNPHRIYNVTKSTVYILVDPR